MLCGLIEIARVTVLFGGDVSSCIWRIPYMLQEVDSL